MATAARPARSSPSAATRRTTPCAWSRPIVNWQKDAHSDLFELREIVVFPDADPDDQTQPALIHIGVSELDSSDLIDSLMDDRSALEQAKDFLVGELAFGAVPVADLRRGAEANGHSWPTVERAEKLLGVQARRISSAGCRAAPGRWEWFLELQDVTGRGDGRMKWRYFAEREFPRVVRDLGIPCATSVHAPA